MSLDTFRAKDSDRKIKPNGRCPTNNKENVNPLKKKDDPSQNYVKVLRDVKASASKTFLNVKCTFDSISQRIRRSTQRNSSSHQQYKEFEDNQMTPVKLYSPFGIVTPSPRKDGHASPVRTLLTPRRFMFASPTGKIKQDIADLSSGIKELNTVAESLQSKKKKGK